MFQPIKFTILVSPVLFAYWKTYKRLLRYLGHFVGPRKRCHGSSLGSYQGWISIQFNSIQFKRDEQLVPIACKSTHGFMVYFTIRIWPPHLKPFEPLQTQYKNRFTSHIFGWKLSQGHNENCTSTSSKANMISFYQSLREVSNFPPVKVSSKALPYVRMNSKSWVVICSI